MAYSIPVNLFEDAALTIVQGLKKRFAEGADEFKNARISVIKTEESAAVKPAHEIIVKINGARETAAGIIRDLGLSILVFSPMGDQMTANRLTAKTVEYVQSLTALGKIKAVTIEAAGIHIENPGPEQLRQITATVRIKSNQTTLYPGE